MSGSLADVAATSFYPAKPLGGYGDGGAIFTDNDDLAAKMISIRQHGEGIDKYHNVRVGVNGRLDTLQATVLLAKMSIFAEELEARQKVADRYEALTTVEKPHVPEGYRSGWALYSVLSDQRTEMMARLKEQGVPAVIYYVKPLHVQEAFGHLGYKEGDFPVSESASQRIFSLPMHPYLSDTQIDRVIEVVNG